MRIHKKFMYSMTFLISSTTYSNFSETRLQIALLQTKLGMQNTLFDVYHRSYHPPICIQIWTMQYSKHIEKLHVCTEIGFYVALFLSHKLFATNDSNYSRMWGIPFDRSFSIPFEKGKYVFVYFKHYIQ